MNTGITGKPAAEVDGSAEVEESAGRIVDAESVKEFGSAGVAEGGKDSVG